MSGGYDLVGEPSDGAVVWRTRALEAPRLVHGFATRQGGVSDGSFVSLNFGLKAGDDPRHVRENLARLARRLAFDATRLFRARQVHGRTVRVVGPEDDPAEVLREPADALVTAVPGTTLGILTADCVPVLLADVERGVVGAAHAGWRGVVAGVLQATVETLAERFGCAPRQLRAALGPGIRRCCYEVGPEVAAQFASIPGAVRVAAGMRRPHLDLPAAVRHILGELGIEAAEVDICTRCREELCFSYRRDGEAAGHHLSVVGLR
jgi:hypothetical protein